MKKTTAIQVLVVALWALGGCAHTTPLAKNATPPPPAVAHTDPQPAHASEGWVKVRKGNDAGEGHWLACRSTRRLCDLLMPHEAGDTADQVAFKHTLCQLYLQFECPQAEDANNRG